MQINNSGEAAAAYKALRKYDYDCAERERVKRDALRKEAEARLAAFIDPDKARAWALSKWERDKERGVGKGMEEDRAIVWYIECLVRSMADVEEALGITLPVDGTN